LDPARELAIGRLSLSQPSTSLAASINPAIRSNRGDVGFQDCLNASAYGTHSLRRTKACLIYRRTKNLTAVQLLLGHTKLESTVRYLGIEVDDALEMAEQT
jgi:integrase